MTWWRMDTGIYGGSLTDYVTANDVSATNYVTANNDVSTIDVTVTHSGTAIDVTATNGVRATNDVTATNDDPGVRRLCIKSSAHLWRCAGNVAHGTRLLILA